MAIDVFAADEQSAVPVDLERWSSLARAVLESRGIKGNAEVSVLFVDEVAIAALNERFLDKSGPTDVLAFPVEDDPLSGAERIDITDLERFELLDAAGRPTRAPREGAASRPCRRRRPDSRPCICPVPP